MSVSSVDRNQEAGAHDTLLAIRGLQFGWGREALLLEVASLHMQRGERVLLHGPSGCGKSTLLNLIAGVLKPTAGEISILGTDLATLSGAARDRFRADHIGVIFQQFNLLPYLNVLDNTLLSIRFSPVRRKRIEEAGSEREARQLLAALGLDADALATRGAQQLSVGQQQRVAAARALIGAPELLIADEPTSALDADARAAFIDLLLKECTRTRTAVLFVTHDLSLAPGFDRVLRFGELNAAAADRKN
jgi:putative ABC transport system ATP-binding protein